MSSAGLGAHNLIPGLAIGAGICLLFHEVRARRLMSDKQLAHLCAIMVPVGLLGARFGGWLESVAGDDPASSWSSAGAVSWAGVLLSWIASALFLRSRRIPVLEFFDALAPCLLLAYAIGRVACHVSGDGCYGVPTDLPWGCTYPDGLRPTLEVVHPTPLYESLTAACILGFVIWPMRSRARAPGEVFAVYLVLQCSSRFAVEFLRRNPRHLGLSAAQWFSLAAIATGLLILGRSRSQTRSRIAGAPAHQ